MTTFNEYRKQQEADLKLQENNLYTDPASKQSFIDDDKAIMGAFMFNFVGMLIGYNIIKDKKRAKTYFKSDLKLQLPNITDDNNNMSLIIKIMDDKGAFKSSTTAAQITRFLVKLKQGSVDEVEPEILIGWMNGIKENWWSKLGSHLKVTKEEFIIDKDQYKAFMNLRVRARVQTEISKDFFDAFRGLNVEKSKITKWDVDMMSKKSIDQRLTNIANGVHTKPITTPASATVTHTAAPIAHSAQAMPVAKSAEPTKQKIVKKPWPGNLTTIDYLTHGNTLENFYKEYTSVAVERKGVLFTAMQTILNVHSNALEESKLVELAKYIKDNANVPTVLKLIGMVLERTPSSMEMATVERLLIAQNLGLFDGISNACTESDEFTRASRRTFHALISEIIRNQDVQLLNKVKAITLKLGHGIQYRFIPSIEIGFVNAYLQAPTVNDFIAIIPGAVTTVDGNNVLTYTSDFNTDNAVLAYIMKEYHIQKPDAGNAVVAFIVKRSSSSFGYDFTQLLTNLYGTRPYDVDATQKIGEQLSKIVDNDLTKDTLSFISGMIGYISDSTYGLNSSDGFLASVSKYVSTKLHVNTANKETVISLIRSLILLNKRSLDPTIATLIGRVLDFGSVSELISDMRGRYYSNANATADFVRIVKDSNNIRGPFVAKFIEFVTTAANFDNRYSSAFENVRDRNNAWDILSKDEQTDVLNKMVSACLLMPNLEGKSHEVSGIMRIVAGPNKDITFKDLNKEAKEAYLTITSKVSSLELADKEYFALVPDQSLQSLSYRTLLQSVDSFDMDDKAPVIQRYFKSEDNRAALAKSKSSDTFFDMCKINDIAKVFNDSEIHDVVNGAMRDIKLYKRKYSVSDMVRQLNNHKFESMSKETKNLVFAKTLELLDDTEWISKISNDFKDGAAQLQDFFDTLVQDDRDGAQQHYDKMSLNMKRRMAESYLTRAGFSSSIDTLLHNDESPITPYEKLDKKRIKEILKYNNVTSAETKVPGKFIKSFDAMDDYIKNSKDSTYTVKGLENQKVETVQQSQEELDKITVDLHRNKRNGKHGDTTLKVLRAFKVSIPMQEENQKEWHDAHPNEEIINPMFHGTGSIGASMILRYGFRVISSGDKSVVGRMLGDGIYGSNIIDKAQQYVGDAGFGRRYGTKGYVFKMNACLGEKDKDYKVAGLGRDSIRSPEWCVFTPNSQFKIFYAYEVEFISPSDMADLLKKYPQIVTEKSFKDYLTEKESEKVNYTTYTFVNGIVPNGPNPEDIDDFEDFVSPHPSITLEPSAYGPTIVIAGTAESKDYLFKTVSDFRLGEPEEYAKFLKYFK
jgi:hypothetical protein